MRERVGPRHKAVKETYTPRHFKKKTAKERVIALRKGTAMVLAYAVAIGAIQTGISEGVFRTKVLPFLNPYSYSLQLPTDPCTQISPLITDRSPAMKKVAKECIREEKHGEVVVVDFIGLGKKRDDLLARQSSKLFSDATAGILHEKVTVMPASESAQVIYHIFSPTGFFQRCDPIPSERESPAAFALETMPEIHAKYPNATVISLTPQTVCTADGNDNPDSNTAEVFQDGRPINNGLVPQLALNLVHEGLHAKFLGHQGHVYFKVDKNIGEPYVVQQNISIPGSKYHEYGEKGTIMGTLTKIGPSSLNYIQTDDLNAAQGVIDGPGVLHMKPIGTHWKTLYPGEVAMGDYASIPLKKPVTLQGYLQGTTFTDFLIIPKVAYNWRKLYSLPQYDFWFALYDSTNTHNVAWATNPNSMFRMNSGGYETIKIDGQNVAMKVTPEGSVALRQLANS